MKFKVGDIVCSIENKDTNYILVEHIPPDRWAIQIYTALWSENPNKEIWQHIPEEILIHYDSLSKLERLIWGIMI